MSILTIVFLGGAAGGEQGERGHEHRGGPGPRHLRRQEEKEEEEEAAGPGGNDGRGGGE